MPKRGPLRGPPAKRQRDDARSSKSKTGKSAATSASGKAPFALKWDEDVESSDESADELTRKKARAPDDDADEEEMDPEQRRKQ